MYILKNAWTSIVRNKGRNVLIGIIIIVISCACTVNLAIKNTAKSLTDSYVAAYDVEANFEFDRESMRANFDFTNEEGMENMRDTFSNIPSITVDEVVAYADSDYVKSYSYTYDVRLNGNSIESVTSEFSFGRNIGKSQNNQLNADFTLKGYSSLESMEEFITGSYSVTDIEDNAWDTIFDGNYCMINSELADLNEISVGDKIILENPNNSDLTYELTVLGIFEENNNTESSNPMEMNMFSNSANTIITNVDVIRDIVNDDSELSTNVSANYILTSYDDASLFEDECHSKGMNEYYTVSTNEDEITSATSSISNVSSFTTTFLVITLIIGAIVLFVINQINVRERKYEIGVLRTIGMKKSFLTLQFITELSVVAVFALLIGAGIGATLSKPVGNMLLEKEVSSSQENIEDINSNFGGNKEGGNQRGGFEARNMRGVVTVSAFDSIDAVVDVKVLLQLLGIGFVLTLISSTSSMLGIQKFSPLQILKERS